MENLISNFWNKNKIILKSFLIGILSLLLLIPTLFIQALVSERKERQEEALKEISSRWAGSQTVTGPVIGIPYTDFVTENNNTHSVRRWAYFLPGKLNIKSKIVPERRYRGIYQVVVYTTELQVNGSFDSLAISELGIPDANLLWNEAAVFFNVGDIQGLKEEVFLELKGAAASSKLELIPAKRPTDQFRSALSAALPGWYLAGNNPVEFSATVSLKGTGNLLFVPIGRETKVEASSSWSNPSFTGSVLPDLRSIKDSGFDANWKVLALNRKYPQQWKEDTYNLESSAFGVDLIVPVDAYQQTTRSVKYAILIIILTFTAFFLIEWIYSRPIHSLQYLLVGFALCIFYTLLLSLSEYLGFNTAYGLAAAATIGLIGWYVGSMLRSSKMSMFIIFLLAVQYGFVFTLIQLQDYALLMGSIGIFLTLAVVMYFSRKIKWNS
ncbi:MAG: cell envelope integrity protein CreD [Bacteroidetes bacterium]|nr:cell envelope integrity protein CreD [Bacteroidota bacterium]